MVTCSISPSSRLLPNTRVQRTRSSPSAPRSPLTRYPLGGWISTSLAVGLLALVSALSAVGCTHTETGANFYFPPGSEPAEAKYQLSVAFVGAARHAYVDRTKKKIGIVIRAGDAVLLSRQYTIVAGDLDAGVTWEKGDDLTVFFFEPGVYAPRSAARAEVLRLHFTIEPGGSRFVEAPLPVADLAKVKIAGP